MHVMVLTHGTRGDVQPFAALTRALLAAGHRAVLGAPAANAGLAVTHGLPFAPLDDGPNRLLSDPMIRRAIDTNYRGARGKLTAVQVMRRTGPLMDRVLREMRAVTPANVDLIVHPPGIPAFLIANDLGIPAITACLQPGWVPTAAYPNPLGFGDRLPARFNRATYLPMQAVLRQTARQGRRALGLSGGSATSLRRDDGTPTPVLQAFSRALLPTTAPPDTAVHVTTGFWFLPAPPNWAPAPALTEFLAAGPPPVVISFGSMAGTRANETGATIASAITAIGVRAIVLTGGGGIAAGALPTDTLVLDQAPHDWLFPRAAAIVHHGGAGTTAAASAAGVPQVICPFVADQPFWARRVHVAGAAATPLPQRELTPAALAGALSQALTDPGLAAGARTLETAIRAEPGVTGAVRFIVDLGERRLASRPSG